MPRFRTDMLGGEMIITLADEEHRNELEAQLTSELVAALCWRPRPRGSIGRTDQQGHRDLRASNLAERSATNAQHRLAHPVRAFPPFARAVCRAHRRASRCPTHEPCRSTRHLGVAPAMISLICLPKCVSPTRRRYSCAGTGSPPPRR